ncbi:MAG TPA: hypothetical protein VFE57_03495 [Cyclobacteriaceae bacterium]|jgi:hypothetical protein|nr:hypothetical protein [Cyclobacteriaceae bacterium]
MRKILIIEDDNVKIERLLDFFKNDHVVLKESFQSGLREIKDNFKEYDFLLLDMTIPLWEKGNNDLGGNYEQFGGERILREMKRKKLLLPTLLFTMFDIFPTPDGNLDFAQINILLKDEFKEFYLGAVFYDSNEENWKAEITNLLSSIQ